jgi:hypothetical protein
VSSVPVVFDAGNPFPETPAARLSGPASKTPFGAFGPERTLTVSTVSVRETREQVDKYFDRPLSGRRTRGRAFALVGQLGVGKTHLIRDAADQIRERHRSALLWVIDEVVPDLSDTYRTMVDRLRHDPDQRDLLETVIRDYSADVTAVQMERRSETEVAAGLRNREYDPDRVIEKFRLDDEEIYREMRRHLGAATESFREFANAMALLPDPRYSDAVWHWLAGDPPAASLNGRGITTTISGTARVLDTLAMFAFLYGRTGEPCILMVDSLEKVLDWPIAEQSTFVEVFERLVNVYINLGGLLVFCIQPEPLSRLRPSLYDRISQIWPEGLTPSEVTDLIGLHLGEHWRRNPAALGAPVPPHPTWPFTEGALTEVAAISGGNPRRALKLCGEAWRVAEDTAGADVEITATMIHTAARAVFEQVPHRRLVESIGRALARSQWPTRSLGPGTGGRPEPGMEKVAFEVTVGGNMTVGIAVFGSVFTEEDLDRIRDVATAVRTGSGHRALLVVVNGYLSQGSRDYLSHLTASQPVVFGEAGDFEARVLDAIGRLASRLEAASRRSSGRSLDERITALSLGQLRLTESVNHLGNRLEGMDRSVHRIGDLAAEEEVTAALPESVSAHFDRAFDAVAAAHRADDYPTAFGVDSLGMTPEDSRPQRLRFDHDDLTAIGVETLVTRMLTAFRENVANWIRTVSRPGDGSGPTEEQRHSLFVMCRSFEITAEVLPLVRLDSTAGGQGLSDVVSVLMRLGGDVMRASLDAVGSSAPSA